jgi:hypothetical protein
MAQGVSTHSGGVIVLILTNTTDSISIITSQACQLHIQAFFNDRNQSTGLVGLTSKEQHNISTAATTTIVASPAATTTRNIKSIDIRNANTTIDVDVTIQYNANGTLYQIHAERLYGNQMLQFVEGKGFSKIGDLPFYAVGFADNIITTTQTNAGGAASQAIGGLVHVIKSTPVHRTFASFAVPFYRSVINTTGSQFALRQEKFSQDFIISGGLATAENSPTGSTKTAGVSSGGSLPIIAQTVNPATSGITIGLFSAPLVVSWSGSFQINEKQVTWYFGQWSSVAASGCDIIDGWHMVFEHTG